LIHLRIKDNINAQILSGRTIINEILSVHTEFWVKSGKRKICRSYQKYLGNDGIIYTGWIKRIENHCKNNNIELKVDGKLEFLNPNNEPFIEGYEFRPGQKQLVETAIEKQRGILKAATAVGKTVLAGYIISCFKDRNVLFLCSSVSIATQTIEEFEKFGFDVCLVGNGRKEITTKIVVGMIQTIKNLDLNELYNHFDIIIVDEAHLKMKKGATGEKVLSKLNAPIRLMLTATLPEDKENRMMMEGLCGGVIDEISIQKGIDLNLLLKPKIELINVPESKKKTKHLSYQRMYEKYR
jgi:superfamily II DNA or RNA helicase